jgi:hypothetical protein
MILDSIEETRPPSRQEPQPSTPKFQGNPAEPTGEQLEGVPSAYMDKQGFA